MQTTILQESNYKEEMQTIVEPYLASIGTEFYLERHAGQKIHCMRACRSVFLMYIHMRVCRDFTQRQVCRN